MEELRTDDDDDANKNRYLSGLLTKFVWSRWLAIGQVFFFACLWNETKSRSINSQKKNGQDAWILAKFFFCMFMERDKVEVHKLAQKEQGQYPAILIEQTWSIRDLLYGFRGNFSCRIQWAVLGGQDASILPVWVANHITQFGSSCPLPELAIQ